MKKMHWDIKFPNVTKEATEEEMRTLWETWIISGLNIRHKKMVPPGDHLKILKILDAMKKVKLDEKAVLEDAEFELLEQVWEAGGPADNYQVTLQVREFLDDAKRPADKK